MKVMNKEKEVISIYEVIKPIQNPSTTKDRIILSKGEKILIGEMMMGLFYENSEDGSIGWFMLSKFTKTYTEHHLKKIRDTTMRSDGFHMLYRLCIKDLVKIEKFVEWVDEFFSK